MELDLKVDDHRSQYGERVTNIYVRAKRRDGSWGSVDIAELDRASLWLWLTSMTPDACRRTVLAILGHNHVEGVSELPRAESSELGQAIFPRRAMSAYYGPANVTMDKDSFRILTDGAKDGARRLSELMTEEELKRNNFAVALNMAIGLADAALEPSGREGTGDEQG